MKQIILILTLLLSVQFAFAQKTVTGNVVDSEGFTLPGATIIEDGTNNGVTADFDGNFSISVSNEDASITVSFIGYQPQTIAVAGKDYSTGGWR